MAAFTKEEKAEFFAEFERKYNETDPEINEKIKNVIRWMTESNTAEESLRNNDLEAENVFSKIHRTRASQISVSAVCGCGKSVEGKRCFEKTHYSSSSERKLRGLLGTCREHLREKIAFNQAQASEAVSSMRFALEPTENREMNSFWRMVNSVVQNSERLEAIGLREQLKSWIIRLILSHRAKFSLQDESQLMYLLTKMPEGWLAQWASKLAIIRIPDGIDLSLLKHYHFMIELVLCSSKSEENPPRTEQTSHSQSTHSSSSENFFVLEDDELLGGFESESPPAGSTEKPSLGASDLIELTRQLRLSESIQIDGINVETLIDIFCLSLEIYSTSSTYIQYCSVVCSYLEAVIRKSALDDGIEGRILRTSNRLLRISRLNVLESISAFPLEQLSRTGVKRMVNLFLFVDRDDGVATNQDSRNAEHQLANLHKTELVNYIKAASCFLRKIDFYDEEVEAEMVALVSPLISLMVRVCFVLSATKDDLVTLRQDIFGMLVDHHPPILSLLIIFFCDALDHIGETGVKFISDLPSDEWIPGTNDISIIQDLIVNNSYDSIRSKLGQTLLLNINFGYLDHGDAPNLPLSTHYAVANICVRESIRITESNQKRKLLSRTQETLGLAKLKLDYLQLIHSVISKLLLNIHLRDDFQELSESVVSVDSSSNPILGPAAVNRKDDLASAYILTITTENDDPVKQMHNIINCGKLCIDRSNSAVLSRRLLEIALKKAFVSRDLFGDLFPMISGFLLKVAESDSDSCLSLISHLMLIYESFSDFVVKLILLCPSNLELGSVSKLLDLALKQYLKGDHPAEHSCKTHIHIRNCLKEYMSPHSDPPSPKSKWHNFASAFSRVGFSPNDLTVKLPPEASTLVKLEILIQLENLFRDPALGHLHLMHAIREELVECPSQSAEAIGNQVFSRFKIQAPISSLPIYKVAELLLATPFNDPALPRLTYTFLTFYLQESNQVAIGHRFFDVHPYVQMISDLRKRLVEASEFHTDSISQGPQVIGVLPQGGRSLASLLWTAALWLEEPRVHDSRSELVYLPPQYGAELLMRIRSSDNSDWELVKNLSSYQMELESSSQNWLVDFKPAQSALDFSYLTTTRVPMLLDPPSPGAIELTQEQDAFPSKAEILSSDIPLICRPLISEVILAADWQTSSLAELTQLDINYIELLPDLYQNMPQVIEVTASCGSGFRGHACQAPARVPVEIQLRTKIQEVFNSLSGNRNRYQEIRTSWSNPQRWVNLGHVAYSLTRMSQILSDAYQNSVLESEREEARKQGEALFFTLVTAVTPSVTSFAPCSRIVVDLVEQLAGMFCAATASYKHLDVSIRYPSLAPILAPYFHPNPQQNNFGEMYTLVMQRLNRGHTSFAFSLLSKFKISEYAARCDEESVDDLILTLKSGLFALAGDMDGDLNVDFDSPQTDESKDLVKDILTRHACDILWVNPNISAETILQTFLHVTGQGDGFGDAWSRLGALFDKFEPGMIDEDVVDEVIKLLFGHFGTIRHEEDFFSTGPWPPVLPIVAQIVSSLLNLMYLTASETSIQDHMELVFTAIEPFLKPKEVNSKVLWPIADETEYFWDILMVQLTRCSTLDESYTQRYFLSHLLSLVSYKNMDPHYAERITKLLESISLSELVPTSDIVEKLSNALKIDNSSLVYLVCLSSVSVNWTSFFYSDDDDSKTMAFLFKILTTIISDDFPIYKMSLINPLLLPWPELPWEKLSNGFLRQELTDLPGKIGLDSFTHPTSSHQKPLQLLQDVFLNGEGNSTMEDLDRRRTWLGCMARCVKRNGLTRSDPSFLTRLPQFLVDLLEWCSTGIPNDSDALEITNVWGEVLHVVNYDNSLVEFFVAAIKMESDLVNLRLYITTANRIVKDPACQLMLIETSIERSMILGHGLALLHGTLCTLPFGGRDELRTTLCMTETFLTPLLLLQEQLRPNLPVSSKVKLISQNAFYVKGAKPRKGSEWKLACFLHQIVRLTLSLWQAEKEDGALQVFVHNDIMNLLSTFFFPDSGSILLSMIGMVSASEPSPEFQIMAKSYEELISNFCKGLSRDSLQEFALLGIQSNKFCSHNDFVCQLSDLIEKPSVENSDEILRTWARLTNHHLASFYLENP